MVLRSLCRQQRRNKLVGAHGFWRETGQWMERQSVGTSVLAGPCKKGSKGSLHLCFMGQQFAQVGRCVSLGWWELCGASQQLSCLLQSCPGSGGILLSLSGCGAESLFKVIRGGRRISREEAFATLSLFFCRQLAKSLGQAGEIEPETEGILTEYGVDFSDFCPEALECLPQSLPWVISPGEMAKRRDLR